MIGLCSRRCANEPPVSPPRSYLALTLDSRALSPFSGKACGRPLLQAPPWHGPPIPCNGISMRLPGLPRPWLLHLGFGTPLPRRALKVSLPPIRQAQPAFVPSTQLNNASCSFTVPPPFGPVSWQLHASIRTPSSPSGGHLDGQFVVTTANRARAVALFFFLADTPCRRLSALLLACRSLTRLVSPLHPGLASSWFFRPLTSTPAPSVKP